MKKSLVSGLALALAAAALLLLVQGPPTALHSAPPVLGTAPVFSLVADDGRPFTSGALQGQPWLASFLFTSCPGPCPRLVERLKFVRRRIPASSLPFASFTVDPATDTAEVLARYKRERGLADEEGWTFLTGPVAEVVRVVEHGFVTAVERSGDQGAAGITHGTRAALVDATGQIRGFYALDRDEEIDRLERDLALVD